MPKRRVVSLNEAIRRIGDQPEIHTFMNAGNMLIGADHDREGLIAAMTKHGVEEAGEMAAGMGHTLVIVNYPTMNRRTTSLFIEAAPRAKDAP